jgi:RNA polymerase sigma-70 factor, ECF subfamily
MMGVLPEDSDELIEQATLGDVAARQRLLVQHQGRLRQMVAVRIDPRIAARLDPSDIVQEALADATRHLDDYLRERPLPFYLWLRRLTWERLVEARRRHIDARRRSVTRERRIDLPLPDSSAMTLANRLLSSGSSPSRRMVREETCRGMLSALEALPPRDREVLVLRYLEGLSTGEIAAILGVSAGAVMTRHTRALSRLRDAFAGDIPRCEP